MKIKVVKVEDKKKKEEVRPPKTQKPKEEKNTAPAANPPKAEKAGKESGYSAKNIFVLEGLEPVRKRPGMYIGTTGLDGVHHLVLEVVDNSIDEAMAGHAKHVLIELLPDNKVAVTDDGRGIPVDIHPQTKKSALETVLTTLHAGGKFGGGSYKVSGGLHGVGVSVVNALSIWMRAEVYRDGIVYSQEYKQGKPTGAVKKGGKSSATGTKIIFQPDPAIFPKIEFDLKRIVDRMRQHAYLTNGIHIEIIDSRKEPSAYYGFYFDGGVKSFLRYLVGSTEALHREAFYVKKEAEQIDVEVALVYTNEVEAREMSFANNIYTADGGTHLTGFRSALTRTLNDYARSSGIVKSADENLTGDDVREGLVAIVSVKILDPQFEGQTKGRLGNTDARTAVEAVVGEAFKEYLEHYGNDAKAILQKNLLAAKARKAAKAAKDTVLRKGMLEGLTLPGKLADCSSRSAEESELFIVEGDSAGGCFSGETKVALADGRALSFTDIVKEHERGITNYCYTLRDGSIAIEAIRNPRRTKKDARVLKVTLDNGEEIVCTPDHRFMLADGTFKEARELTPRDSLMPLYRQYSRIGKRITIEGYELVFDPGHRRWIFTHMLADEFNVRNEVYTAHSGAHRHHKDFDKLNNNPTNIVRLATNAHLELHRQFAEKTLHRPAVLEKLKALRKTPEYRDKIRQVMLSPEMNASLRARAQKQWEDPAYKERMAAAFLRFYRSDAGYRERNSAALNAAQKKYWADAEHRALQAARTKGYFADHAERKEELSVAARVQWQNGPLREWRSRKTKEQWTQEFREKRKSAYNETYRDHALRALRRVYDEIGVVSIEKYDELRRRTNDKSLLRFDTIMQRFFGGEKKRLIDAVLHYNHKITKIESISKKIDVYDLEVPGTHNFALASGVFVHNSAKQGRDRRFQAILPLKGKILNVEKARIDKMLANKEVRSLVVALGTAISDSFNIEKLRYHKIILMTDADVDGAHITTLLLTLFYRYFPKIVENGHLYLAQPPLFRIQKGKEVRYAYSDDGRDKVITSLGGEQGVSVSRYKGLGEMNPSQLWETTMDPSVRMLKQISVHDTVEADRLFGILMGEAVEPRKNFIQAHATTVKNLDI